MTVVKHKAYRDLHRRTRACHADGAAPPNKRGRYHQLRLAHTAYAARDCSLAYGRTAVSDSPRAIHEELLRRSSPLNPPTSGWSATGLCRPQGTVEPVLREGSRKRRWPTRGCVIANDHYPTSAARRASLHGAPLKQFHVSTTRASVHAFHH